MNKNNIGVLNKDVNFLKIVAVIAMTIDHIGLIFFPHNLLMRFIGRIAFPIFTYTTMIGYFRTKNLKKYILRLLIVGIISQPIYMHLIGTQPNVMFTLIAELLLYYLLDNKKWAYIPIIILFSFIFSLDYAVIYLFLVIIFYYCKNNKFILFLSFITFYFNYAINDGIYNCIPVCLISCSIFCLPFIMVNTKFKLHINNKFFYIFYPFHLFVLLIIKLIIN